MKWRKDKKPATVKALRRSQSIVRFVRKAAAILFHATGAWRNFSIHGWSLIVGCRSLVVGRWSLVVGRRSSIVGRGVASSVVHAHHCWSFSVLKDGWGRRGRQSNCNYSLHGPSRAKQPSLFLTDGISTNHIKSNASFVFITGYCFARFILSVFNMHKHVKKC